MRNVLILVSIGLYICAVVQLRRAWRYPSAEGAGLRPARRWLHVGLAAPARYFTAEGRTSLRYARWLFGASFVLGILWLTVSAFQLRH